MLNLHAPTTDRWLPLALGDLDAILLDHAHCEKKAASTALSLVFKYPEHEDFVLPLSRLAREELSHFELVLDHLHRRGLRFERQRPSPYAGRLMAAVRPEEPGRLVDTLLCCALIEARSCERMKLLADGLAERDPALSGLYRGLLASEARHHALFVDLARLVAPAETVRTRLAELAVHEAEILATAPDVPRMHN
jgi:tRNA-(ms[2]io[6]A)-hydroxylase